MDTATSNAVAAAEFPFNVLSGAGGAIGQAAGGGGRSTTTSRGSGGGGLLGTVICTELFLQGRMDWDTYQADCHFGLGLPSEVVRGYHLWAVPLTRLMRRSRLVTAMVAPIALEWAKQMRREVNGTGEGSWLGKVILRAGVPVCGWLGGFLTIRRRFQHERA